LAAASAADPATSKVIGAQDPTTREELERQTLAKMLAPVAASMRPKYTAPRPPAAERPGGSMAAYLFWFVILLSAAAMVASFAIR